MIRRIMTVGSDTRLVPLINSAVPGNPEADIELVSCANEYSIASADQWAIPYGEVPYDLGGLKGTQRFTRESADKMVALFNSKRGKLTRRFGGLPIYVGHPDHALARSLGHTDTKSYGWIKGLEAGEHALLLNVDMGDTGASLLENKHYKWFSPFFYARVLANSGGGEIFEPVWLKSAGLTNNPRWPVEALVNADITNASLIEGEDMDLLQKLVAILGLGTEGAEAASVDGAVSAVTKLLEAVKKARAEMEARWDAQDATLSAVPNEAGIDEQATALLNVLDGRMASLVNDQTALQTLHDELVVARDDLTVSRDALQTSFTDERVARVELLVNQAITDGRVKTADQASWVERLNAAVGDAFATECTELVNAGTGPKLNILTNDLGERQSTGKVSEQFLELVNSRMKEHDEDYMTAFNRIKEETPGVFADQEAAE